MSISPAERRFIRYWEEQRQGGKTAFVAVYTFGYLIIIFMTGVAIGLFTGLRFVTTPLLLGMAAASLTGAFMVSLWQWKRQQQKFSRIIKREIGAAN